MRILRAIVILLLYTLSSFSIVYAEANPIVSIPKNLVEIVVEGQVSTGSHIDLSFSNFWTNNTELTATEVFSCWAIIPDRGKPDLQIQGYDADGMWIDARGTAEIGNPVIMRGSRMAPIFVRPYILTEQGYRRLFNLSIQVTTTGRGTNEVLTARRSRVFDAIIGSFVINLPINDSTDEFDQEHLLVICPDFAAINDPNVTDLVDFVNWKRRKGVECTLKTLSEIGVSMFNAEGLKDYIQEAYEEWDNPPDFVLLAGDETVLPYLMDYTDDPPTMFSYASVPGDYVDENYFVCVDGNDIFPDIILGRWVVDDQGEYVVLASKLVTYEMFPNLSQPSMFKKAVVAAQDSTYYQGDPSMRETKMQTRDWMLDFGFSQVDTLFDMYNPYNINNWINEGRGFLNYRGSGWSMGWAGISYYFDLIYLLQNQNKLTVVTGIGCGVGKFDEPDGTCFGEIWMLLGTPTNHRGAISFVGPGWNTHTDFNNELDLGIYSSLFVDGETRVGAALLAGKLYMYDYFDDYFSIDPNVEEIIRVAFNQYYLLADPEFQPYTDAPAQLLVDFPQAVLTGSETVNITVTDDQGAPFEGAQVCLYLPGDFQDADLTGPDGTVELTSQASMIPAYVYVTVTAHNYAPVLDSMVVVTESQYVLHMSSTIDDQNGGNGDGEFSPGETVNWTEILKNYGILTASDVHATLSSNHPLVGITQDESNFGNIATGDSAVGNPDYELFIAPVYYIIGDELNFSLYITDGADSSWTSDLSFPLLTPSLEIISITPDPTGNGRLDRGETCDISFAIRNNGLINLSDGYIELSSDDPYVTISVGSVHCGNLNVNSSYFSGSNPFVVEVSPYTPSMHPVELNVTLTSQELTYIFADTTSVVFTVGAYTQEDPSPDTTSTYYGYESMDTLYTEAPQFEWFEIDPELGGPGFVLPFSFEDQIHTIPLQFTLRYWGEDFSHITICADGWVMPGATSSIPPDNYNIPHQDNVEGMIAGLWDNLWNQSEEGRICTYYDSQQGRFYIEYSDVSHYVSSDPRETFQIVLCDPAFEPTATGDGEILFFYKSLHFLGLNFSTVGIESPDELYGIEYSYNGSNPITAFGLADSLAIKWTTDPPLITAVEPPRLEDDGIIPTEFTFDPPYPNPFNPSTSLSFAIPHSGHIELSLYNVRGQRVDDIFEGVLTPGRYTFQLNASSLSSGLYFARLEFQGQAMMRKLLLIK